MIKEMYRVCRNAFTSEHRLQNSYMFEWESDIWLLTKSGYSVEIEIKVSRSDFFADFKKVDKHKLLSNYKKKYISLPTEFVSSAYRDENRKYHYYQNCYTSFKEIQDSIPNRFYYGVPKGLVTVEEVPSYAGLIYVDKDLLHSHKVVKKAPLLHKNKKDWTSKLMDKYHWRKVNSLNSLAGWSNLEYLTDGQKVEKLSNRLKTIEEILR